MARDHLRSRVPAQGRLTERRLPAPCPSPALPGPPSPNDDSSGFDKPGNVDPDAPLTTEQVAQKARSERLADRAALEAAASAAEFAQMPLPVATEHPSRNTTAHLKHIAPYIIVDPHKVSHAESLYIAALGKRFADAKVRGCWFKFSKYFNGHEALEMIGLREGMKRKETWGILMHYQEHLVVAKHW